MLTRVTSQVYLVLTGDKLNGSTVGAHPVSSAVHISPLCVHLEIE